MLHVKHLSAFRGGVVPGGRGLGLLLQAGKEQNAGQQHDGQQCSDQRTGEYAHHIPQAADLLLRSVAGLFPGGFLDVRQDGTHGQVDRGAGLDRVFLHRGQTFTAKNLFFSGIHTAAHTAHSQ